MSNPHQGKVSYLTENHFFVSAAPKGTETEVWMVLHGYGQLASFFLRKFNPLFRENRLIVAPEGINRFYQEGVSGRVGANWMTRHERETDIQNGMNYLNAVMQHNLESFKTTPKINVLGFSQGAATASRWVAQSPLTISKLVLWGGGVAYDIDRQCFAKKTSETQVIVALGDQDPFLSPEKLAEQKRFLEELNMPHLSFRNYQGGHDLNALLLQDIFDG